MLTTRGRPRLAAARATADSPSGWTIDSTPTGASTTGAGIGVPSTVTDVSSEETSRSMRGTSLQASNAARFARAVDSDPAAPATYANDEGGIRSSASASRRVRSVGRSGRTSPSPAM